MERRQFTRKTLGGGSELRVSLFLHSRSLLYDDRTEEFEIEASAYDICRGGMGLKLHFSANFIGLRPDHEVMVRLSGKDHEQVLPARVAHFHEQDRTMGIEFIQPLTEAEWMLT